MPGLHLPPETSHDKLLDTIMLRLRLAGALQAVAFNFATVVRKVGQCASGTCVDYILLALLCTERALDASCWLSAAQHHTAAAVPVHI